MNIRNGLPASQWINWRLTNEGESCPSTAHRSRGEVERPHHLDRLWGPPKQPAGCWALSSPRAGGLSASILTAASLAARSCRGRSKCWRIPSYAEYSPSGWGSRFGRGTLPKAFKRTAGRPRGEKQPAIEAYSQGRYFAFTGGITLTRRRKSSIARGIDWLFTKMNPPKAQPPCLALPESDHALTASRPTCGASAGHRRAGGDAATLPRLASWSWAGTFPKAALLRRVEQHLRTALG